MEKYHDIMKPHYSEQKYPASPLALCYIEVPLYSRATIKPLQCILNTCITDHPLLILAAGVRENCQENIIVYRTSTKQPYPFLKRKKFDSRNKKAC